MKVLIKVAQQTKAENNTAREQGRRGEAVTQRLFGGVGKLLLAPHRLGEDMALSLLSPRLIP